jgi:hypothetical protein
MPSDPVAGAFTSNNMLVKITAVILSALLMATWGMLVNHETRLDDVEQRLVTLETLMRSHDTYMRSSIDELKEIDRQAMQKLDAHLGNTH